MARKRSSSTVTGQFNSSITRVRPVFRNLLKRDPTGVTWLAKILNLASVNREPAVSLAQQPGELLPELLRLRAYKDGVLKDYGIESIQLAECFEKSLPPPAKFLAWLIDHAERMKWPDDGKKEFGNKTQKWRKQLVNTAQSALAEEARKEAKAELARLTASGSWQKWWAFEGFTEVDCYLETEHLILFIEGKRTESISIATDWFPYRNQLVRNLEVAQAEAKTKGKAFALLVIVEDDVVCLSDEVFEAGLPHFDAAEREQLKGHYLGCVLWKDVCASVSVSVQDLPNTVSEAVEQFQKDS